MVVQHLAVDRQLIPHKLTQIRQVPAPQTGKKASLFYVHFELFFSSGWTRSPSDQRRLRLRPGSVRCRRPGV